PPARTGPASAPSRPEPAPSRPESAPSLRQHALLAIRHAITTGDLHEQTIYSAAGLAKQLGISLSPVRAATTSLVAEGTVDAVPHRRFPRVPVTREDLEEIVHIRALLAGPAVESLCARAVEDPKRLAPQLEDLRGHAENALASAADGDTTGFMTADRIFHEHLL